MNEQDGTEPKTKQPRKRRVSKQNGIQTPALLRPVKDDKEAWKAYWKAQGQEWRTEPEINNERQKYLTERRSITPDIENGIYPFKGIKLSRDDVEWLLTTHKNGHSSVDFNDKGEQERQGLDLCSADLRGENLRGLPLRRLCGGLQGGTEEQCKEAAIYLQGVDLREAVLEEAILCYAHLDGARLEKSHLEGSDLTCAHLENSYINEAHLEGVSLYVANLERASLDSTHLEGADLRVANLRNSFLYGTHLESTQLRSANLQDADLREAHLEGANLYMAHLEGAFLEGAHLEGKHVIEVEMNRIRKWKHDFPEKLSPTDLREAFFNSATRLRGIILGDDKYGFALIADLNWGDVNLSVIDWSQVTMLGDEQEALDYEQEVHQKKIAKREEIKKEQGIDERKRLLNEEKKQSADESKKLLENFQAAIRANRQLASAALGAYFSWCSPGPLHRRLCSC